MTKTMTKNQLAMLAAGLSATLCLSGADLTVAAGDSQTISEDATYDTVTVYGTLSVSQSAKLTAANMYIMPSGVLDLYGSTTSFSSVSVNGEGYIRDYYGDNEWNHATVNVTGDGDSKMTQLDTASSILKKSGKGTLTIAPRHAMHNLTISGGKVILQSRAAAGYRWYKFKVKECRSSSATATQMDELYWFDKNGNDLSDQRTSPVGSTFGVALYDRNSATKWFQNGSKDTWNVNTVFPGARPIRSYMYWTANDEPVRDPSAWIIEASIDGNRHWDTIASVTNFMATITRNTAAAVTNFLFSTPSVVTIPTITLDAGTTLEVDADTSLAATGFSSSDFGGTPTFCNLSIANGGVFAWEPSADKTLTFLNMSGGGTFRKEGSRDITILGDTSSISNLYVAGGTLTMRTARRETRRFFKFKFKKSYWMTTHPNDDYTTATDRHKLQFGELALYDGNGVRVSLSSNIASSSLPSQSSNLFDGNQGTSCYSTSIPETPLEVSFELKEGVAESIAGYRFCSAYNYSWNAPMPGEWEVYARASTSDSWELIDHQIYTGSASGYYWTALNGGIPFVFTNAAESVAAVTPSCKVKIDGGATLDVSGTATTFANLVIDCSAVSDATLIGGGLAAAGEIALENVALPMVGAVVVPLALNETEGVENIGNWSFTVNGETLNNWHLSTTGGRIALCTKGTMLIFR